MSNESEKTDLIHRIPVWVRICAVLAYFMLFSMAASDTTNSSSEAAVNSPAAEGGQPVAAHHIPWVRLIVPDLMVAEWFESDSNRIGILDRLPILAGALLLLGAVLLIGHSLLRLLRIVPTNTLESSVYSFAVGMSAVSLYVLLIGLAGGLRVKTLYIVPVVLALVYEVYHCRTQMSVQGAAQQFVARLKLPRQAWLILLPFGLIVAGAILPPWEFDVREYHMQVPAEWYRSGQIDYLPHNVYGNMPLASELILIPPMALGSGAESWYSGALIGKTMMSFYVFFAALAVMAIARKFGHQRSGWAAAILVVSCPWIGYVATTGLNEVALGCFIVTSVLAILNAQTSQNPLRHVLLAGVFAGSAAATKYTGVVFAILPLLVWTLWVAKTRGNDVEVSTASEANDDASAGQAVWTFAVVFTIGATIVFSPWLIKNAALTGNPTYPLLSTLFVNAERDVELGQRWDRAHQVPASDSLGEHIRNIGYASSRQSPLLMGLLVLSCLVLYTDRRLLPLALYLVFAVLAWWFATHHLERFLVPLIPLSAVLAGVTLERLFSNSKLFWGVCIGLSLYGFMYLGAGMENDSRVLVKLDLLRHGPALSETTTEKVHRFLNAKLTGDDVVLLVGDAEPFDLTPQTIYATCFDPDVLQGVIDGKTPTAQRGALAELNVDYIYVSWEEIKRYRSTYGYDSYVTRDLFNKQLLPAGVISVETELQIDPAFGQLFRCNQ
ncbi:MAG: hypothetical protein VB814_00640 [Pirellulaceae bacterium]